MSGAGLNIVLLCGTWAPLPWPPDTGHTHGVAVNTCATRDAGKSSLMVSSAAALRLPPGQLLAPKGHPASPRSPGLLHPWHMALPPQLPPPDSLLLLSPLVPKALGLSEWPWPGSHTSRGRSPGPPALSLLSLPGAPQPSPGLTPEHGICPPPSQPIPSPKDLDSSALRMHISNSSFT